MSEPRKLRVFLCHSSQDKPIVRELYQKLANEDWIDPWLDEEKLLPGQDWDMEIEKAVKLSDAVIVCISKNSLTKEGYVQKELRSVLNFAEYKPDGAIFIIPLRLENCELPRQLARLQYVDYFPAKIRGKSYDRLLVSLENRNQASTSSVENKKKNFFGSSLQLVAVTIFILMGILFSFQALSNLNPAIETPFVIATNTKLPALTLTPNVSPSPVKTLVPVAGSTMVSQVDGMIMHYVPKGTFLMGSDSPSAYPDEKPPHSVSVDAFWMAETEVTNAMFDKCINDNECISPVRSDYYSRDASLPDYPVVFVTWNNALNYCEWVGGRLPTEAEWEYAASGTDKRVYPWGNDFSCQRGNFDDEVSLDDKVIRGGSNCDGFQYLAPVGQFPSGASPFGILDMAGNVWEWTLDWYGAYQDTSAVNPTGSESGDRRVVRGGAWLNDQDSFFRATNRYRYPPDLEDDNLGFRCVVPVD